MFNIVFRHAKYIIKIFLSLSIFYSNIFHLKIEQPFFWEEEAHNVLEINLLMFPLNYRNRYIDVIPPTQTDQCVF